MGKRGTVFICMAGSQQAQAKSWGCSLQDQPWSQQSFLKLPFNSCGIRLLSGVGKLWGTGQRSSYGKRWVRIHCHTPGSSGCHHGWSKHQFQALHTSFSSELMYPLHFELLRWHFPSRYLPLTSNFLEEAFVLFKQCHRLCLQLLTNMREREDAFAVPSREGTPAPNHDHLMAICPTPGPECGQLSWPSAGQPGVSGTICTGDDWGRWSHPPSSSTSIFPSCGLHKALQHSHNMLHRATSPCSSSFMRYLQKCNV